MHPRFQRSGPDRVEASTLHDGATVEPIVGTDRFDLANHLDHDVADGIEAGKAGLRQPSVQATQTSSRFELPVRSVECGSTPVQKRANADLTRGRDLEAGAAGLAPLGIRQRL